MKRIKRYPWRLHRKLVERTKVGMAVRQLSAGRYTPDSARKLKRNYGIHCDFPGCTQPVDETEVWAIKLPAGSRHLTKAAHFQTCTKHEHWFDKKIGVRRG